MTLTAQQHEIRSRGIGGSDAAAALGFSKWKTPVKLYLEKIGEIEREEDVEEGPRYWGGMLEDIVAREYMKRTGVKVRRRRQAIVHKKHDFMFAHLDRSVDGESKLLECKTSTDFLAGQFGPDGSDEVPDEYLIQVQHQMACTGYDRADLAVLIGNREFRIFNIPRDDALIGGMVDREYTFWHDHVLKRYPPDPLSVEDILDLYPVDTADQVLASPEDVAAWVQLRQIREQIKALDRTKGELELELKAKLAEHSELRRTDGQLMLTWKRCRDSTGVLWKALAEHLLQSQSPNDQQTLLEEFNGVTREGVRKFLVKEPKSLGGNPL